MKNYVGGINGYWSKMRSGGNNMNMKDALLAVGKKQFLFLIYSEAKSSL
jgi:hypothetical protein